MSVNRNFALAIALCFVLTSVAVSASKKSRKANNKEIVNAQIKVGYNYFDKHPKGDGTTTETTIPMVLLVGGGESKFFSSRCEWLDSLTSTAEGRALEKQLFDAAVLEYAKTKNRDVMSKMASPTQMYVFKNHADSMTTIYDVVGLGEFGMCTEPFSELNWEIGDSIKTVLGYECIMATTDYHGRHWTAWFTPEIPVSDGPWKFIGLPGLILEASESTGQHRFVADGIEQISQPIYPIYNPEKYNRMKRLDMLRSLRYYRDNSKSIAKASIGLDLGTDTKSETVYDFLETDYR